MCFALVNVALVKRGGKVCRVSVWGRPYFSRSMAKKNNWVQFARNQAYKAIGPSSSESSREMRKLLEAAGRLDGLDPKVFAGEHRNIESQPQVMRLHVFLGHRFAEGRCFGCQKELAAAMMLRRCLRS